MIQNYLKISERTIRAYNLCTRKAYLLVFSPNLSSPNAYENMQSVLRSITSQNYFNLTSNKLIVQPFSPLAVSNKVDIITSVNLSIDLLSIINTTLIKVKDMLHLDATYYGPVIFSSTNKVLPEDKIELSFVGYTLSKIYNYIPENGYIVLIDGRIITVKLSENIKKFLPSIILLQRWLTQESDLPPVFLNKHCPYCEFQSSCKETATKEDSLSLLGGMTKKQILKLEKKGIFTIKQLSYLYRPRKRGRRSRQVRVAHKYELQALALRTGNIYIQDKITDIPKYEIEIFIDFECVPDEDFFYLFGVVVCQGDKINNFQFWASSKNDEELAWKNFISVIEQYGNSRLFHYGSFENKAICKLGERYETLTKTIIERLFNINTCIYGKIYFPVYSNSLKDICKYFDLSWSSPNASGLQSIVWRHEYDQNKDDNYRELLQSYNLEDCLNLKRLTEHLRLIAADASHLEHVRFADKEGGSMPETASNLSKQLSNILFSAHGSYEQKKIRLKVKGNVTTSADDSSANEKRRSTVQRRKVTKVVQVAQGLTCPNHPERKLKPTEIEASQTIFDLVFTAKGIKKQVTQYIGKKGRCYICKHSFNPPQIRNLGTGIMYGHGFIAWVSYHRLVMRLPYNKIVQLVEDSFGERVNESTIQSLIVRLSAFYIDTEQMLLNKILKSPFVHMDETTINIDGASQYVWVITDGTHVIFKLSENREATIAHELLNGYSGVLCSDFYGGYDSVNCVQQKCWVHLIRDLNENLRKSPFDTEYENFVCAVGNLITPILQDVEKYGLKTRHLHKFKLNVAVFYEKFIDNNVYASDVTQTFQNRFVKYREKLFVFLDIDGIPWNNNAAERAIRHLAVQRKISGSFGQESTPQYLRLLGVTQTCRFQNKSLLQFLLSGEKDIDVFKGSKGLIGWRMH